MYNKEIAQQHSILSLSLGPILVFFISSVTIKSLSVITTNTEDFQDHDKVLRKSVCFL